MPHAHRHVTTSRTRRVARVGLVVLTGLLWSSLGPASTASAAVDPVRLNPAQLTRGADQTQPHIEGTTLVDGTLRLPVTAERVDYLARSGADYLVAAHEGSARTRVLRITPAGAISTVTETSRNGELVTASRDGSRLAQAVARRGRTSSIRVWDTATGAVVARRSVDRIQRVLDVDARRVVIGDETTTQVWRLGADGGRLSVVVRRGGYRADLDADRLASLTGDPYDGGCSVVSRLSAPGRVLWRSCSERVEAFAPGGRRMATVDLLADGLGPSQVQVRSAVGVAKGVYRVRGYFSLLTWEDSRSLVLQTWGREQGAAVRCTGPVCQRAGELATTPDYRRPAPSARLATWG